NGFLQAAISARGTQTAFCRQQFRLVIHKTPYMLWKLLSAIPNASEKQHSPLLNAQLTCATHLRNRFPTI
ncbi:MAG: hypothetical protein ACRC5C_04490, partial [Bacilli bacterium]